LATLKVHIVTGDTRGTAAAELAGLDVEIAIISHENQSLAKANYIINLDPDHVIAIGLAMDEQRLLATLRS